MVTRQQRQWLDGLGDLGGILLVAGSLWRQARAFMEQPSRLDDTADNPELVIHDVDCRGVAVRVVRDDELVAGSKQRAIVAFVRRCAAATTDELLYAGPTSGHAQVALAFAAQRIGMKATLFVAHTRPRNALTDKAASMGCRVVELPRPNNSLRDLQQRAAAYHAVDPARRLLLPFGLHAPEFIDEMAASVSAALPRSLRLEPPQRVWVACGSATLLAALARVWPDAHLLGVQVGKWVSDELLGTAAATIMTAPEFFTDAAELPPPPAAYASVVSYDAKVWQFVLRHASDRDLVWNVARDPDTSFALPRADSTRACEPLLGALPPVLPLPPFGHHHRCRDADLAAAAPNSTCEALLARLRWSAFDVRRIALVSHNHAQPELRSCLEKVTRLLDAASSSTRRLVPHELSAELVALMRPLGARRYDRHEVPFYRRLQQTVLDAVLLLKLAHGHSARHNLTNELGLFGGAQAVFDSVARLFNTRDLAFPLLETTLDARDLAGTIESALKQAAQHTPDASTAGVAARQQHHNPLGILIDLFSERERMQARVAPGASARPLDMFHRREALQKLAERCHEQLGALHMPTLRDMFLARAREASWLFAPLPELQLQLVLDLSRQLQATHVFDAEVGWGERLLAARICGHPMRYTGRHNADTCAPSREHVRLFEAPSQQITVLDDGAHQLPPSLAVDLAFVSPLPLQCTGAWLEDLDRWASTTVRTYAVEAWSVLAAGGTMVLLMSPRIPERVFQDIVTFVSNELAESRGREWPALLADHTEPPHLHCWTRPLTGSIRRRGDVSPVASESPSKRAKLTPLADTDCT